MNRIHPLRAILLTVLLLAAALPQMLSAETAHKEIFLWRIEGKTPSFMFGTIHVPDDRATILPPIVNEALQHADAMYGELSLAALSDVSSMMSRIMLPEGTTLKDKVGLDAYNRFQDLLAKKFAPPGSFDQMHPTFAMMNYVQLDMMPHLLRGKQVLDMKLAMDAIAAGKENGGLETMEEQLSMLLEGTDEEVAESFMNSVKLYERLNAENRNMLEELLVAYLSGDQAEFQKVFDEYAAEDPESNEKFMKKLINERNHLMADRIAALLEQNPGKSYFFAIGAGHFLEDGEGIQTLLANKGLDVTRISIKDKSALPVAMGEAAN